MKTLSGGAFQDSHGTAIANGYLILTLSAQAYSSSGKVDTSPVVIQLDSSGNAPAFQLWGNDELTPSTTYYNGEVLNSSGRQVIKTTWTIPSSMPFTQGQVLLQSAVSNAPSQTGSGGGILTATAVMAPCTPGSMLVICSVEQSIGDTPAPTVSISGIGSWNTRGTWGNTGTGPTWKARGVFSFLPNSSTFSGSVSVSYNFPSGGVSRTDTIQFAILEFSGVTSSVSYLDGGTSNLGSSGIPDPGSLGSSANGELVVTGYTGNTTNSGVPSGFTAGPSLSGLAFAGMAYKVNCPSSQTAAWSSGSQTKWGAGAHSLFSA